MATPVSVAEERWAAMGSSLQICATSRDRTVWLVHALIGHWPEHAGDPDRIDYTPTYIEQLCARLDTARVPRESVAAVMGYALLLLDQTTHTRKGVLA